MIKFDVYFPVPQPYHDEGLIRLAVGQGAMKVVEAVVAVSPGRAKLGWKIRFIGQEAAQVYADQNPPLSLWLEYGTKPHTITRHGAILGQGVTVPGRELYGPGSGRARRFPTSEDYPINLRSRRLRTGSGKESVGHRTGRPMLRFETNREYDRTSGEFFGDVHFAPQVHHPGIKPRFYLREAWQTNQADIINDIRIAARNKISGELGIFPGAGGIGSGRYKIREGGRFAKLR